MTNFKYILAVILISLSYNITFPQTWVQQSSGTTLNLNSVYFIDANTGFIGADSGKILKTTNGGINWVITTTGFNFNIISVKFFSLSDGVAAGDKVIKTTNGGSSWSAVLDTAFATDICYLNSNTWYVSCILPHTNKMTSNQGVSWQNFSSSNIIQMSVFFVDQNTGWISGKIPSAGGFVSQHIYSSTSAGMNWSSQYTGILQNGNGWFFDINFINSTTGFGVLSETGGIKIIKTSNGGDNWISTTTPSVQKNIFFINNSIGWTCGFTGVVMKTLNTGNSWASEQTPVSTTLNSICFVTNEIGLTCGVGGVILKTTNGGITAIQQSGSEMPINFSLSQNYPNPFNPVTQIGFDIPGSSFVNLIVYDGLGREIEYLVNGELNPGSYNIDWNASNYPSGLYFYKLEAGSFIETKKMVLIK